MQRIDHFNDPNTPRANTLVPAASAIITNEQGEILLHRLREKKFAVQQALQQRRRTSAKKQHTANRTWTFQAQDGQGRTPANNSD